MPGHMVHLVVHHDHHQKYQEQVYWVDQLNLVHIDIMIHVIVNHNHLFIIFWKDHVDGKHLSIIFACKFCFFSSFHLFFIHVRISFCFGNIFILSHCFGKISLYTKKIKFMLKMFWQKKNFLGNQNWIWNCVEGNFFPFTSFIHFLSMFFLFKKTN